MRLARNQRVTARIASLQLVKYVWDKLFIGYKMDRKDDKTEKKCLIHVAEYYARIYKKLIRR